MIHSELPSGVSSLLDRSQISFDVLAESDHCLRPQLSTKIASTAVFWIAWSVALLEAVT